MGTLAEGIKEIFSTAKTTGSNVMLCGNDGTPDGHMTMDKLASVLGANYVNTDTINNADEAPLGMTYVVFKSGTPMNVPDSNHVLIQTFAIGQGRKVQYAFSTFKDDSNQGFFYRISNNNSTFTNVDWIRMYDPTILNDSSILSSLANALGARIDVSQTISEGQHYNFGNGWFGLIRITIVNTTTYASPAYIIVSGGGVSYLNRPWWIFRESDINLDSDGNFIIYNEGSIQTFYLTKIS